MISRRKHKNGGFTLVELLVVISIIALLVAILVPALGRGRQAVRSVACRSNMKQLMNGMSFYIADHDVFPGTHSLFYFQAFFGAAWPRPAGVTWDGALDRIVGTTVTPPYSKPYHLDADFVEDVPRKGTLFKYIKDEKLYVCPSDRPGDANDTPIGGGGNGRLSYSLQAYVGYKPPERLGGFTYVAASNNNPLPGTDETRSFAAGQRVNFSAAAFMTLFEEHPGVAINGSFPDGNFNELDRVATRHMTAAAASGKNPSGRSGIAFLDGHAESPTYPCGTDGRQLFTSYGHPYFWRASGPPDQANMATCVPRIPGPCPW